jgi:PAS domain S-box-containing protein
MEPCNELLTITQRMGHIGSWEMDFLSGQMTWSDEIYHIFGLDPREFSRSDDGFLKNVHPEDRAMVDRAYKQSFAAQENTYEFDYRIIRCDNKEVRYVHELCEHLHDADGEIIKSRGILQDVTDRKELEIRLRKSEERFRLLANDMPAMMCEFLPDSTLTYVNQAYCDYYEMTEQELIGRRYLDLLPEHRRYTAMRKYLSLTPENPINVHTYSIIRKGELKWREWRDRAFFDETGEAFRFQGLGIDVTDRKRAEAALKETNRQLKMAKEKAEDAVLAKSRFLASMSHEIRTPLNGIVGMLQVMAYTNLSEEQIELLEIAQTSSDLLLNLINNILDYSKIESGKSQLEKYQFNIMDMLNEVETVFKPMAEMKGLKLYIFVEEDMPKRLVGDAGRLKQVLLNLLSNAVKFTSEGRIDVQARLVEQENGRVTLKWMVKDTGIGIPEASQKDIFLSFTQADVSTNREYGGTGLGLAICKSIVEQMEGDIWVTSEMYKGSQFYFTCTLEVPEQELESPDHTKITKSPVTASNLHLLVVDDDETSRILIDRIAHKRGWQVTQAGSGREAIAVYQARIFDIILMDLQMPELDGAQTTLRLREMEEPDGIHTPIIAVTAKALPGDRERCMEAGLDDYLTKPFTSRQLMDVVESWTKA